MLEKFSFSICWFCLCRCDICQEENYARWVECENPFAKPVFDEEMKSAALYALRNEKLVLGESVFKFEEEFARYCGARYAVSTSSGYRSMRTRFDFN